VFTLLLGYWRFSVFVDGQYETPWIIIELLLICVSRLHSSLIPLFK